MNIRAFQVQDIPACVHDFMEAFNSPPWSEAWRHERAHEYIHDLYHHPKFIGFILSNGQEDVAYALCYKTYWWSKDDREKLHLDLFFTKPAHQHQGYGHFLLHHIEAYVIENNLKGIMLMTRKGGQASQFYEREGFQTLEHLVNMEKWFEAQ